MHAYLLLKFRFSCKMSGRKKYRQLQLSGQNWEKKLLCLVIRLGFLGKSTPIGHANLFVAHISEGANLHVPYASRGAHKATVWLKVSPIEAVLKRINLGLGHR